VPKLVGLRPLGDILAQNVSRRHLTAGQRAMIAAEIANLHGGAVYSSKNEVRDPTSSTREQAAGQLGTTPKASDLT
jgi:hypothetical protein